MIDPEVPEALTPGTVVVVVVAVIITENTPITMGLFSTIKVMQSILITMVQNNVPTTAVGPQKASVVGQDFRIVIRDKDVERTTVRSGMKYIVMYEYRPRQLAKEESVTLPDGKKWVTRMSNGG